MPKIWRWSHEFVTFVNLVFPSNAKSLWHNRTKGVNEERVMAALGESGGSSLVKAQVKQPPSPPSKQQQQQQQQNEKQLHNLLQQASTVNHNGGNLLNSPAKSCKNGNGNGNGPFEFFQHLQHLATENMPPVPNKGSPNGKNNRTKVGFFPASDHVMSTNSSNGFADVKTETSTSSSTTTATSTTTNKAVMSPNSSSNRDEKKINNNSVSYTSGGRLKFFKGNLTFFLNSSKKMIWPESAQMHLNISSKRHKEPPLTFKEYIFFL